MAATVYISETNGVTVVQDNVSNMNFGSNDSYEIVVATYPISTGTYSYEKWERVNLSAMGGSNKIDNFRVWMSGTIDADTDYRSNLSGSGDLPDDGYVTPVNTSSPFCNVLMPVAEAAENLGVSGATSNGLQSAGTYSDYWVTQLEVSGTAAPGDLTQKTFYTKYDES